MKTSVKTLVLLVCLSLCPFMWAQTSLDDALFGGSSESSNDTLDYALFGGSSDASEEESKEASGTTGDSLFGDSFISDTSASQENTSDALLERESVTVGGGLSFSLGANALLAQEDSGFTSSAARVNGRVYLDARPSSAMRFYVRTNVGYSSATGSNFSLHEAFIDTDVNKQVFIRAGKQTINWGVGSILRTANLMNVEGFDREKPDQELAGPVAIKVQYPIGINNLTGYGFTVNRNGENALGVAALYEYLVGNYELTSGARYAFGDNPWAIMTTLRGGIPTPIGGISVSAEAVLEGNIDKRFVIPDGKGSFTSATSEALFFSGELGLSYSNRKNENFPYYVTAAYAFNGKGYDDSSILRDNPAAVGALLATNQLSGADLAYRGQHYAALGFGVTDIAKRKVSASTNWFANLSDGSGSLSLDLSYSDRKVLSDYVTPTLQYSYNYGEEGTEFASNAGHQLKLQVNVGLGGRF